MSSLVLLAVVIFLFMFSTVGWAKVAGVELSSLSRSIESSWGCDLDDSIQEPWFGRDIDRLYAFKCDQLPDTDVDLSSDFGNLASDWVEATEITSSGQLSPITTEDTESNAGDRWKERAELMKCRAVTKARGSDPDFITDFVTLCVDNGDDAPTVYLRAVSI